CAVSGGGDCLYSEIWCGGLERVQVNVAIRRCHRVEQEGEAADVWRNLLEEFQPLTCHRRLCKSETRDVTTRSSKSRDETTANRIGNDSENDGNCACLVQYRSSRRCVICENEIGL